MTLMEINPVQQRTSGLWKLLLTFAKATLYPQYLHCSV